MIKINSDLSSNFEINHEEKKSLELRKKVNELYFAYGHTKSSIMEKERVSKPFVIRWTQSPDQDFYQDNRGWLKGKPRYFSEDTADRVQEIYRQLKGDPHNFYMGGYSSVTRMAQELSRGSGAILADHRQDHERSWLNPGSKRSQ